MGLDIVELVMALEEEFEVQISDRDAEKLVLVGQVSDYIAQKPREPGESHGEDEIWNRVKRVVIEQLGVKPEQVTRQTNFVYDLGCG